MLYPGNCFGCSNVGIDLKHPASGGYQEGNEHSGFPFDLHGDCDDEESDEDLGFPIDLYGDCDE